MNTGLMPLFKRHCFPLYFLRKLGEDFKRDNDPLVELQRLHSLERLKKAHFSRHKGKTAFILGTGGSVNKYTASQWEEVADSFSIGVNFWLLHDFVPNAFSLEIDDRDEEAFNHERDIQFRLLEQRALDYANVLMMTRGRMTFNYLRSNSAPSVLQERLKLALCLRLHGEDVADKEKHIKAYGALLRLNRHLPFCPYLITPGISATILFLTLLCYEVGFRDVVLCGVDLNSSSHFYEDPLPDSRMVVEDWPRPTPQVTQKQSKVHVTFDRKRGGGFHVKDHLMMVQELLFKDQFTVYSGSPESALVPELPVYPWGIR